MNRFPVLTLGLAALLNAAHAFADVTIIRDGKPEAKIYVSQETDLDDAYGGDEPRSTTNKRPKPNFGVEGDAFRARGVKDLIDHLEIMSGAKLEMVVVDDPAKITGPAIVIGPLAAKMGAALPAKPTQTLEAFRLVVKGDKILVAGESERGTLYGIYEILTSLGCDWVMPGKVGQVVPKRSTVTLADRDVTQAPAFVMRRLWYRGYHTKEHPAIPGEFERFDLWSLRQRRGDTRTPAGDTGGHVWDQFIRRHKEEFDKDPTMLALTPDRSGKLVRRGPQLEAVHPRVAELFAEEITKAYEKNIAEGKWTKDTPAGFGIGPADGLSYSVSPEAIAAGSNVIDPMVGDRDQTDIVILLANRILEKVKPKYPNAMVGFYSYSVHEMYPKRYVPDPNIAIIFAPINFSRFHGVTDPNSRTQAVFKGILEQWGELSKKQGNPLLYRGYSWNLAENMLPFTKVRVWGEEIPFYNKFNIKVMNVEGTKMWSILGPSDYIFMRLCWDSTLDWKKLLHEYCMKAYGKGGPFIEEYQLMLAERQSSAKQEAGSYHAFPLIYDDARVAKMRELMDKARAATADSPADRTRVEYMANGPEALRIYLAYFRATQEFDFPEAAKQFAALRAQWDKMYALNSDTVSNEAAAYLKRFIAGFVERSVKYSTAPYQIIDKLPDELPTKFDDKLTGYIDKLHEPATDDSKWQKTKTISSTWDSQRISDAHRSGGVWYRHRFTPKVSNGQAVGLFLGGFEDEARVWVNGQFIGTSGRRFSNPAEYDLTDAIKPGAENVLAIQIIRNSSANELGLGGIIRPSFIFTGPKLEKKAPGESDLKRVLPGGELGGDE